MLDILLYQEHYEKEIDWAFMRDALEATHTDGFLGDIQYLGKKYLGFDFEVGFE